MPYDIRKQGNRYCVFKTTTGKTVPGGCHATKAEAQAHKGALYHHVEDASEKKSEGKKVKKSVKSHNNPHGQKSSGIDYRWKGR